MRSVARLSRAPATTAVRSPPLAGREAHRRRSASSFHDHPNENDGVHEKTKRARHWRALFVTKHICSEPLDLDIVLLQRVTDLARGQAEQARGLGLDPAGALHCLHDALALDRKSVV